MTLNKFKRAICLAWAVILGGGSLLIPSETAYGLTESSTAYYDTYIKVSDLGHYDFEVEAHEIPSNEILPIIDKSYFPITVSHFQSEIDNTAPSAIYKSKPVSKVDVVFAFGETDKSDAMQKYIPSFESRLQSAGNFIDAHVEKVETSTISTSDQNSAEIFRAWFDGLANKQPSPYWRLVGSRLQIAYSDMLWDRFVDISKNGYNFTDGSIYFNTQSNGDRVHEHQYGIGIRLRDPQMTGGYAISFGKDRQGKGRIAIWKLNGRELPLEIDSNDNRRLALSTELNIDEMANARYRVKMVTDSIEVYMGDKLVVSTKDSEFKKGTYGIWARHSDSGIWFDNFTIETGSKKSLGEAISDVSWRDNSTRFVVYAEDTIPEYMKTTDNKDYQYTVTKLLNSNAYLVNLGTSLNQATLEQLVKFISTPTEQKGTFILNNSTTQSMNKACDWIIEKVRNLSKPEDWILVNTEVIWETEYNDQEHDLPLNFGEHDGTKNSDNSDILLGESWGVGLTHLYKNEKIFAEKWRYRHFNNYFDNSTIRESYHNTWIEDPITIFPNPGLYRVNYKRRDNPLYPDVNLTHNFDSYRYWSENYDRIQ